MIEISKMGFRYSGSSHMALHDVDLTIRDGEFVGLIGVSGAVSAQVRGFSLRARGAGYKEYPFCLGDLLALLVMIGLIVLLVLVE